MDDFAKKNGKCKCKKEHITIVMGDMFQIRPGFLQLRKNLGDLEGFSPIFFTIPDMRIDPPCWEAGAEATWQLGHEGFRPRGRRGVTSETGRISSPYS